MMRIHGSALLLLLLAPTAALAQSTVGDVPSDPNRMPQVNGSAAPAASGGAQMSHPMSANHKITTPKASSTIRPLRKPAPNARPLSAMPQGTEPR